MSLSCIASSVFPKYSIVQLLGMAYPIMSFMDELERTLSQKSFSGVLLQKKKKNMILSPALPRASSMVVGLLKGYSTDLVLQFHRPGRLIRDRCLKRKRMVKLKQ